MKIGLSIFLVITSVLMILLVLLHKGKGSGLSDMFGGGISSNYGGSSVVEKNLDRITIVVGGLWFVAVASAQDQWAKPSVATRSNVQ
jgi:preprotein translocase subunit SecG